MTRTGPAPGVTLEVALTAVTEAAASIGLNHEPAHGLGPVGDNAVFLLPGGVVARVAHRDAAGRARREVRVARWLERLEFPAVRVLPGAPGPYEAAGCVVTFWVEVPGIRQSSPAELGFFLRKLHEIGSAPDNVLGPFQPFAKISDHIEVAVGLGPAEQDTLRALLEGLEQQYALLEFPEEPCVIHGDAHRKNIVRDATGTVLMLDLESVSKAPREWDLTVAAVYRRVGWYTDADYQAFAHAYGRDVTHWLGFEVMAAIRQLRMIVWLAARTGREPRLIPEVRARLASVRDPGAVHAWEPGV